MSYRHNSFDLDDLVSYGAIVFVVLFVLALLFYPVIALSGGLMPEYSVGERLGSVYKLSHKGLIWKSWEGEMNLGGMRSDGDGGYVANVFKFSVRDPAVVEKVNAAAESGKRVKLHYHQYFVAPAQIGTEYVVDKVEFADSQVGKVEK